jgi:hypothetical protein
MAITITDKALQEFTDYFQDPVNKYILIYSRKLVFQDSVTVSGSLTSTIIPLLNFDAMNVGKKEIVYNIDGDDTSGVKELTIVPASDPADDSEIFFDETRTPNKDFFYFNSDTKIGRSVSQIGQSSSSDNQQQIGGLDLYLTWSNDEDSYVGNSTIDYDEVKNTLTIDITP